MEGSSFSLRNGGRRNASSCNARGGDVTGFDSRGERYGPDRPARRKEHVDERRQYGRGTYLEVGGIWNTYIGGRAMCSDGVVRTVSRINPAADTFFSVPASVQVKGKTVRGYVTISDWALDAGAGDFETEEPYVAFIAYSYRKNGHLLPSRREGGRVAAWEDDRPTESLTATQTAGRKRARPPS